MTSDVRYMRRALELARLAWGKTSPNPMVGAVVVRDGEILGEGFHAAAGEPHAEVMAFREAERRGLDPNGATLYVTLEPCSTVGRTPPCTEAIIRRRLKRVVIGTPDPNPMHAGRGVSILKKAGMTVKVGLLEFECRELNRAFFKWITTGRPFVLLKMAMTLDGKIAAADGQSKWITGPAARSRVQELRRWADAIMVTGRTVRLDRPRLTVREPAGWPKKLYKIIAADRMTPEEIAACFPDDPEVRKFCAGGPEDWRRLLDELGAANLTSLLIEGGGELAGNALHCGAVDAVEFHIAPRLMLGRRSIPVTGGEGLALPEMLRLENMKTRFIGDDLVVSADLAGRKENGACLPD